MSWNVKLVLWIHLLCFIGNLHAQEHLLDSFFQVRINPTVGSIDVNSASFEYDGLNRISEIRGTERHTRYEYLPFKLIRTVEDDINLNIYTDSFDINGLRVKSVRNINGGTWLDQFKYDEKRRLLEKNSYYKTGTNYHPINKDSIVYHENSREEFYFEYQSKMESTLISEKETILNTEGKPLLINESNHETKSKLREEYFYEENRTIHESETFTENILSWRRRKITDTLNDQILLNSFYFDIEDDTFYVDYAIATYPSADLLIEEDSSLYYRYHNKGELKSIDKVMSSYRNVTSTGHDKVVLYESKSIFGGSDTRLHVLLFYNKLKDTEDVSLKLADPILFPNPLVSGQKLSIAGEGLINKEVIIYSVSGDFIGTERLRDNSLNQLSLRLNEGQYFIHFMEKGKWLRTKKVLVLNGR